MADDWRDKLYFGDNLDILREYVAEESMDLIVKASSHEGDLVLDPCCVRAGTKVVTPLYPPVNGGKGIPVGRSVDGGRRKTPLYPPVSGGQGVSTGLSVDGGKGRRARTAFAPSPRAGRVGWGPARSKSSAPAIGSAATTASRTRSCAPSGVAIGAR